MKKIISALLILVVLSLTLSSCMAFDSLLGSGSASTTQEPKLTAEYVYSLAKAEGYSGTLNQFIAEFRGEDGKDGEDGVGIASIVYGQDSHLKITLTNGNVIDCGPISVGTVTTGGTISIGPNGNWFINGEDSGAKAVPENPNKWHTGSGAPSALLGNEGDLYLNTVNGDVYEKKASYWEIVTNISGNGMVNNEGDIYDVTVNVGNDSNAARYAAAKGLLSAVRIEAVFASGLQYQSVSNGSGVIYKLDKATGDAYIITNHHVVYNSKNQSSIPTEINIYLYGLEYYDYAIPASYVGGSLTYDIAVLKVSGNDILKNSIAAAIDIADSEAVRVLDTAIAIGNPDSAGLSVTLGSVNVESEYLEMIAVDGKTMVEYRVMRIDTPVNSGNSGGGLFDINGRLIGIVNAKEGSDLENMGYAIPSNLAVAVAENIIRNCDGNENKYVVKCVLGISVAIGDIEIEYDKENGVINRKHTCVVSEISTASSTALVFEVGDVLLSFEIDGVTYAINNTYAGSEALLYSSVNSEVYANIIRDGAEMKIKLPISTANFSAIP
ncbi:MAG: trypsin-like peptidase domain-containing protein [Clostridia bacterium]|nr:trypsin-like peptidase domain-containing protein [Clostridia bacterium]